MRVRVLVSNDAFATRPNVTFQMATVAVKVAAIGTSRVIPIAYPAMIIASWDDSVQAAALATVR